MTRRQRLAARLVLAGSFSKILQYLHGTKTLPEGRGIALLTSQNPREEAPGVPEGSQAPAQVSREDNDRRYRDLLGELKSREHVFWKAGGDYGKPEKSVAIINVTPEEALSLGRKYAQESVIWSGVQDGKFVHKMLYSKSGEDAAPPVVNKQLWIKKMQDAKQYYTMMDNRKFTIPFFPGENEVVEPLPEKVTEKFRKDQHV